MPNSVGHDQEQSDLVLHCLPRPACPKTYDHWYGFTDCGPHHNITNGFVEFKGGDTTYGKEYAVKCDKGYNLKGDEKIRCQGDGTWSKASVCLPIGKIG